MLTRSIMALGAVGVLLLAGCGGSDSESESAQSAVNPSGAFGTAGDADGGCTVAQVDGTTEDAELEALATQVYEDLQCDGDQSLDDQLRAAEESDAVTQAVVAGDFTVNVDSAAGGTVMQILQTEGRSACNITVIDNLDAKTLSCADL